MTSFKPVQAQTFALSGAGAALGATSIVLQSFKTIDGTNLTMTDFGTIGYATIDPGNGTLEEQISFSGVTQNSNGTATLTGVKTVLFVSPYTESSGLAKTHAGSAVFVLSNTSAFYSQFPTKSGDETITGQWTFSNTPIVPGSVSDASTSVKGVSYMSVAPAIAGSPTAVGTNDSRVPVAYAADAGSTDDYVITPSPAITAYTTGQIVTFKANTANTGAATLNINSLGAKTIKKNYNLDLTTGDILANQIVQVVYDGTNFQLQSNIAPQTIVRTYTGFTAIGSGTTTFTVTNISGSTYRYTYTGVGTDPSINSGTVPIGSVIQIQGSNFASGNKGTFITTGVGNNYFEISNASGTAESTKTLGSGYLALGQLWTKPNGLSYAVVEVQAAGGNGAGGLSSSSATAAWSGAGAGGYAKKTYAASALNATEAVGMGYYGGPTTFSGMTANAGADSSGTAGAVGALGGTASGGDINIQGGDGITCISGGSTRIGAGGNGGNSVLGHGGAGGAHPTSGNYNNGVAGRGYGGGGGGAASDNQSSNPASGGSGALGIVIITEYY